MPNLNCNYCGRKGILIYPVRYAVACPNGERAIAGLSGNFKIVGGPTAISPAKYTLRALRAGYLYTYEENRKRLKAYIVLPKGGLWEFPVEYAPSTDPDLMNGCCLDRVSAALSCVIDIEPLDCEMIGNIWIGWSNVLWTKETIKKISDSAWRNKHMQRIDAQAMLSGTAQHAAKFKDSHRNIPHFSSSEQELKKAFDFSNTPALREFAIRERREDLVRVLGERCPYGGFIVAVNDPVGITNDLSELTCPTHHAGFDENIYRGQICSQLVDVIEHAVRYEARVSAEGEILLEQGAEINPEVAQADAIGKVWKMIKAGGVKKYAEQQRAEKKTYGNTREGKVRAAEDRAWKDITTNAEGSSSLDLERIRSFPARYAEAVRNYETIGLRLAEVHSLWLKCKQLHEWMEATYDEEDLRSGYAFREALAQCIGKAVATGKCQMALEQWMSVGNLTDRSNLYARALLFNHPDIIAAAEMELRGSDFKPKYLLSIYKGVLGRVSKLEASALIDNLTLTTANILARALGQAHNVIMRNLVIASLTLQGRVFIKPSNLTKAELSKWIIESAQAQGVKLNDERTQTRTNSRKEARRVLQKESSMPTVCAFELDVKTLELEKGIRPGSLKTVGIPGNDLIKKWLGSSSDFNTGAVGVVLQILALNFANEDRKRGDEFDMLKLNSKVAIATISLFATLAEAVTTTLEKGKDHPFSKIIRSHWSISSGGLKNATKYAKGVGAIAGVANAGFDMASGIAAYADGDWLLGSAYIASSLLSGSLAIAGFWLSSAIFWPLFAITFVVGIAVGILRPAPLKVWISRCYFCSGSSAGDVKRYSSLDDELQAFNGAARG